MAGFELTPRERDVLSLLCQGFSNDAIAERLVLSLGTVKWYNKQIFAKLGVSNRFQAMVTAQKLNLSTESGPGSSRPPLPFPVTPFVGRLEAIERLCELLKDHRLITLVGMGGIGKTRLALEVARRVQRTEYFAAWFVPLATYIQKSALIPAIAESLGLMPRNQDKIWDQVVEVLSRTPTLLILDNFEQFEDATPLLDALLRSVSDVRMLVTSRERLHLYGETVFPLEGLSIVQDDLQASSEAVALFIDRAQHTDATFRPDDHQMTKIVRICQMLQGVPLAIEQAASWIHVMNPNDILTEIERGLDILRTEMVDVEPRHQSMRTVIDSSWRRLSAEEQESLMGLSVFCGSFHREAAAEVAHASLDILSGLLAKSFVSHRGEQRYELHEIHRQFGADKLAESGSLAMVRERHARYFATLMRRIAPQRWHMGEAQIEAMNRLDADYANLREAIQWSLAEQQGCDALAILGFGAIFFYDRGHSLDSIKLTRIALAQCPDDEPDLHARAYFALALQDQRMTDDEHDAYLRWALRSANPELVAVAYWQYGDHHTFHQRYDEAQAYYERALELALQTEYLSLYGIILSYMGQMAEARGDVETAAHHYRESYERMKTNGVRSATRPRNWGRMMLRSGDEARARALFREALDNAIYLGSPLWTFETFLSIADYLQTKEDLCCTVQLLAACSRLLTPLREPLDGLEARADALRAALGTAAFDEEWAIGQAMSTVKAIGLAQQQLEALSP